MKKIIEVTVTIFALIIMIFLATSCHHKEVRSFGALPIDSTELNKIPMLVSQVKPRMLSESLSVIQNMKGKPDRIAPTVNITSPSNGQPFDLNSTVNITATASDNVAVASVSISIDNVSFQGYSHTWIANTTGVHTITAKAYDQAGNSKTVSIQITVNAIIINPPPPPVDTNPLPPPVNLPTSINLVMPAVQNQGGKGACCGFATAYARSHDLYNQQGATSYAFNTNTLSPEFIFDRVTTSASCSGSGLITCAQFVRDTGVCLWSTFPYTDAGCSKNTPLAANNEAGNYRAKSFSQVLPTDVTAIKTVLASGKCLVFQIGLDNQFYNATSGFIWKSFTGVVGYHALCMCGYDDSKHAFKIINSWGTSWGDQGYGWIDYDFLPTVSSNLFVFNY